MDKDKNEVLLEELPVILEELFKIIYKIIDDTDDVEEIIKNEAVKDVDLTELIQITDQQIAEYINEKICDKEKNDLVFKVFQKLKINQSIEEITDEVENEEKEQRKRAVLALFEKIIEPDEIEITDKDVCIKYNFGENSKLKNKIDEIDKWNRDNVVETVSRELKVPIDNIILVDNVSSYIDFISNFDENNYVSRGQKDCKFKLEPSLHRIYNDSFQLHSSQYESAFKQRILYYDETTEKKNAEELRAYGQHYGLPTNYLDFTEAHLISLLFAVEDFEYTDNHSIVYPFEKKVIICDCKNKVKPKPFERIFWTKGLGEYVGVDDEYIALPKIGPDIIEFARKSKVRVISQNELSNYKDKQIGYADYQYYGKFMQRLEDKNTGDPQVLHYLPILKKEYISDNPYVTLNIALLILNKLSQENWSDDGKKMIFAEGATVVAYALLDICRDVFGMSQELREKYISTKLTYGDSEATYINGLIESVTRYANEMLAEKIPKEYYNKNLVERMEIPAPHYTKNCIAIIERAYNNPEYILGLLHDIGRKFGVRHLGHVYDGYCVLLPTTI